MIIRSLVAATALTLVTCTATAGAFRMDNGKRVYYMGTPYAAPPSQAWQAPAIAAGTGLGPVLSGRGAITLPGAASPVTIDVAARVVETGSLLLGLAKLSTPVGATLAVASLASLLANEYLSVRRMPDGWEVTRKEQDCESLKPDICGSSIWTLSNVNLISTSVGYCQWEYTCSRTASDGSFYTNTYASSTPKITSTSQPMPLTDTGLADVFGSKSPSLPPAVLEDLKDAIDSTPGLEIPATQISGPASVPAEPVSVTRPDPNTPGGTITETTTSIINITYQGDQIITSTSNVTTTTTVNPPGTGPDITDPNPDPNPDPEPEPEPEPEDNVTPPADPDMPVVPDFYEQKYPDGFQGVWDEKIDQIKSTPLFSVINTLVPSGVPNGGGCPNWPINVTVLGRDYGTFNASPPCNVWTFLKVLVFLGSLLLARRLIFGG